MKYREQETAAMTKTRKVGMVMGSLKIRWRRAHCRHPVHARSHASVRPVRHLKRAVADDGQHADRLQALRPSDDRGTTHHVPALVAIHVYMRQACEFEIAQMPPERRGHSSPGQLFGKGDLSSYHIQ